MTACGPRADVGAAVGADREGLAAAGRVLRCAVAHFERLRPACGTSMEAFETMLQACEQRKQAFETMLEASNIVLQASKFVLQASKFVLEASNIVLEACFQIEKSPKRTSHRSADRAKTA
ncbi:MAG: hypothetical protein DYG94_12070 [Leptolyngbya sp. PLA3]|nr:MAG: hypothetical protein EDM82_05385 [Cyanobacteria bacterium CYA]MCE7969461.1 hypothetical protein [Leptolyngbya sp. PL-A3]